MPKFGPGLDNGIQISADGYLISVDFVLAAFSSSIPGWSGIRKFGRNLDIDSGAIEDIWTPGGVFVPPTQDRIHDLASTDAADASAGTGCQTVEVFGLSGGTATSEVVSMDGTALSPTEKAYGIIYRMKGKTDGGAEDNIGVITATAQTDATVTAQIDAGFGQTLMAIYQIPSDKTGFVVRWKASMNRAQTQGAADLRLRTKEPGEVWLTREEGGIQTVGTSRYDEPIDVVECPALTLIKKDADTSANDSDISAGFTILLKDN